MNIERTEEEQVEAVKDWFKKNGSSIIFGLAIGLASIGGYRFWVDYNDSLSQKASMEYGIFQNKLVTNELTEVFGIGDKLLKEYESTPYAALAALGMAKVNVDKGSLESAEVHLQWVIDNSNQLGLVHTAKVRLIRILASQEKYDAAQTLLDGRSKDGFESLYSEIQADILVAKGQLSEAREQYQMAIDSASQTDPRKQIISMKINDIADAHAN